MIRGSVRSVLYDALQRDLAPILAKVRKDEPNKGLDYAFALSLQHSFLKKFQDDSSEQAQETALIKFLSANAECDYWTYNPQSDWDELLLGEFRDRIYHFFTDTVSSRLSRRYNLQDWSSLFDWHRIAQFGGNGPGSSLNGSGLTWIEKFSASVLSASDSGLFAMFDRYVVAPDASWLAVEYLRQQDYGRQLQPASKLAFVPKSHTEDRIICIEPSVNMFFQKGIQTLLEDRLQAVYGIDLAIQPEINRYMAYVGSVAQTYCTIDLSSASDRISTRMLDWCMPAFELSYMKRVRSKTTVLEDGSEIPLAMVSSMGNAYTFPLQTAIFAAAVEATYRCLGIEFHRSKCRGVRDSQGHTIVEPGTFSVFGDDIICVPEAYDTLTHLLGLLGFVVNDSKSFSSGDFRESCGHDYYCGWNVRGVYCKTLRTAQDAYSLINRLNRWSAYSGIPLPNVVQKILKLSKAQRIYVPPSESDDAGIHIPLTKSRKGVVKMWDKDLQCDVYKYSYWKFVSTGRRVEEVRRSARIRANQPSPNKGGGEFWPSGLEAYCYVQKEHQPNAKWGFSAIATLMSALKGELRGGRLTPRGKGVYRIETASMSHDWDLDREGCPLTERQMAAWIAATEV